MINFLILVSLYILCGYKLARETVIEYFNDTPTNELDDWGKLKRHLLFPKMQFSWSERKQGQEDNMLVSACLCNLDINDLSNDDRRRIVEYIALGTSIFVIKFCISSFAFGGLLYQGLTSKAPFLIARVQTYLISNTDLTRYSISSKKKPSELDEVMEFLDQKIEKINVMINDVSVQMQDLQKLLNETEKRVKICSSRQLSGLSKENDLMAEKFEDQIIFLYNQSRDLNILAERLRVHKETIRLYWETMKDMEKINQTDNLDNKTLQISSEQMDIFLSADDEIAQTVEMMERTQALVEANMRLVKSAVA